jgi:lipopolysaccharide transport system permease protein
MSGILTVFLVKVLGMGTQNLPGLLFFLAALIPWTCFANGLAQASGSMESGAGLISKIYFPRMLVPAALVAGTVVDFAIGWLFFNIIAIVWTYFPAFFGTPEAVYNSYWTWKFIPFTIVLLCLQLSTALGAGLIFASLNAQYRDIRYVTQFLISLGFFVTPVMWPVERLKQSGYGDWLQYYPYLNPMAGVIETYRALLAESSYIPYKILAANFCVAAALLLFGIWFFRKREQRLVDYL